MRCAVDQGCGNIGPALADAGGNFHPERLGDDDPQARQQHHWPDPAERIGDAKVIGDEIEQPGIGHPGSRKLQQADQRQHRKTRISQRRQRRFHSHAFLCGGASANPLRDAARAPPANHQRYRADRCKQLGHCFIASRTATRGCGIARRDCAGHQHANCGEAQPPGHQHSALMRAEQQVSSKGQIGHRKAGKHRHIEAKGDRDMGSHRAFTTRGDMEQRDHCRRRSQRSDQQPVPPGKAALHPIRHQPDRDIKDNPANQLRNKNR